MAAPKTVEEFLRHKWTELVAIRWRERGKSWQEAFDLAESQVELEVARFEAESKKAEGGKSAKQNERLTRGKEKG